MFSSAKVAEIINEVLNKPEYKIPINELKKRVEANELAKQLENQLNSGENVEKEDNN